LLSDVDASTNDVKPPGTSTVTADRWVPDESRQGTVSLRTYAAYISAAGGVVAVVAVLFASIIAEGVKAFSFWWLAYWLDQGSGSANVSLTHLVLTVCFFATVGDVLFAVARVCFLC